MRGRRDVEKHQFIGALLVIAQGEVHWIADITKAACFGDAELDTARYLSRMDIQTRNDTFCDQRGTLNRVTALESIPSARHKPELQRNLWQLREGCFRVLCPEISGLRLPALPTFLRTSRISLRFEMKAKIIITPKKVVVDPQGRAVQTALEHIGYKGIGAVHVGRYLEIDITAVDKETAGKQIDDACRKILSNPIVEDYRFDID